VNIKGVGNNLNRFTELYKKQEEATSRQAQQKTDKLDLSDAAKKLKAEGVDPKRLTEVKLRIESGYYNSEEIISKVADEIIKEFSKEN
jgi:anti-sigma28 factor (negative regulator of flagellin synthesis)